MNTAKSSIHCCAAWKHRPLGSGQHFHPVAHLDLPTGARDQVLPEGHALGAAPVADEGAQWFAIGITLAKRRVHRGENATDAGLGHVEFHRADTDALPAVLGMRGNCLPVRKRSSASTTIQRRSCCKPQGSTLASHTGSGAVDLMG